MRKWGRKITSALVAALLAVNLMVPAGVYAAPRFDEGVETESGEPVEDGNTFTYSFTKGTEANYEITKIEGELTMSAENLPLTVKAADHEWTYDGEAHSCDDVVITAGTLLPGHVLSATNSGEVTNVSDSGVGNNTVSFVKIMNGDEDVTALYKIDTQAGNLTITPKKLDGDAIRISDEDIVYDGSKKTPEIIVMDGDKVVPKEEYTEPRYSHNINAGEAIVTVRDLAGGNYIVSGSRKFTIKGAPVTVKAYNSSKDYGEDDPTLSASVSELLMSDPIEIVYEVDREEGEDAGTYTITPTGDTAQGNYEVTYETGTFTINRKTVSNPAITLSQDEYTYDGTAHEPKVTVKDGEVTIPEDQYTVSYEDNVNAGTAKVTVAGKEIGNYEFSGTKNFTIKKAAVTVKADDKTKEYGAADPKLTAKVEGLITGDKISYTLNRKEGESVGTYEITPSGDAVQGNYSVVYESAVLTIKNKTVSDPVITLSLEEYTYDGEKHEPKITVKDGEVTIPEDQYTVSYENNVNAGTATVIVTGKETGNYEFSGTKNFTIKKAAVTVKADDKTKEYSAADPELTAAVTGLVANDKISYTLTREEGESAGTYEITPSGEAVQGNYSVVYESAVLTITDKTVSDPVITLSKDAYTYAGTACEPEVTVQQGNITIPESEYTVSYENNVNAGTATVTIKDEEGGNYTVNGTKTFTINKAAITVSASDIEKNYGEDDPALTAGVSGLKGSDTESVISYILSREKGEDAGTYAITPAGETEQGNYEVAYENATFTINRKPVSNPVITLSLEEYTYDGEKHEPKITVKDGEVTIPEDQYTVSYENNVNAGTATVIVTGKETGNYEFSGTKNFTIKKAAVTVKADDKTKEYSAADPELTAAVTGLVANDKIRYTLTREEGESAGTYVITPNGDAVQGNYTVQYIPGILTIKEKPRTGYFCKEGDNYVHTKGSKKEMRVVFDSAKGGAEVMKHLTGVYVENDAIPQKFMKLSIGSVIIDVSPEYLDTLSIGEHSLTASFDDGNSVTIKFSVVEADKKENSKTETKKTDAGKTETKKTDKNVATGDDMNMLLMVMLMMSSVAGTACIYKKKKRDK